MKDIKQYFLGVLIVIPLMGMLSAASAQSPLRWISENTQVRDEDEKKDSGREMFRVYRGDHFYVTDYRGADLLRNGINEGYRRGFLEGEQNYKNRSYTGPRDSETFKTASIGYKQFIDFDEYQYYFRRGFELGYYDAFDGVVRYSTMSDGQRNILDSVINGILDIRAN